MQVDSMDWSLIPCTATSTSTSISTITNIVVEDRLSKLPDELLIRILSLLPTIDAAATCVLSRNLRRVFPLITSFDVDSSPISHCPANPYAIECFPTFVAFVTTVLQKFRFHYLTRFRLRVCDGNNFFNGISKHHCQYNCFPDLKFTHLSAWISFPLNLCGLRELDLCIMVREPGYAQLPPAIFSCDTLQVLKLKVNLGLDLVSNMPSYRLPNLKLLHLYASFISEDGFLPRLVSSCPLLEDLKVVTFTNHVHHTTIVSPSLRRLCLIMRKTDNFEEDNTDFVQIRTPNLEYLEYSDNVALKYSIPMMDRLVEAKVVLDFVLQFEDFDFSLRQILCFIRSLSNVQHLALDGSCLEHMAYVGVKDQLPMFLNLNHLKLGCADCWDTVLWEFLNCSPVLETLVFERGFITFPDFVFEEEALELEREFCRTAQETPSCCRFHLKRLVIKCYVGYERELDLIQLLLRHAIVLQELVIYRCRSQNPLPDQTLIENTLKNMPRASVTCTIQVF